MTHLFTANTNRKIQDFVRVVRIDLPGFDLNWQGETKSFEHCNTNARKQFRIAELSHQLKVIQDDKCRVLDQGADYDSVEAAYRPIFKALTDRMQLIENSIVHPEDGPVPILIFKALNDG